MTLGSAELVAFAGTTDLDRAREFYSGVLGLQLERQDAFGTWSAPSGARVAWFRDPDGNTLSVTEMP